MSHQNTTREELFQKLESTHEQIARLQMTAIEIAQMLGGPLEKYPEKLIAFVYLEEGKVVAWVPGFYPREDTIPLQELLTSLATESQAALSWLDHFIHPDDVPALKDDILAFVRGGKKTFCRRLRVQLEGVAKVWLDLYGVATDRDLQGKPVAIMACAKTLGIPTGISSIFNQILIRAMEVIDSAQAEHSPRSKVPNLPKGQSPDWLLSTGRSFWLTQALWQAEFGRMVQETDLSFIKDPSMKYVWVSGPFAKLLGLRLDEMRDRSDSQLFGLEDEIDEMRIGEAVMAGAKSHIRRTRKAGEKRLSFRDSLFPIPEGSIEPTYWILGMCHLVDGGEAETEMDSSSPLMVSILKKAREVARVDSPVLLTGKTGSGKDYLAEHIHDLSPRRNGFLLPVDCAAIPEKLLETELFGYEPGGHSTAETTKRGRFELADGGTLLLDEIGELSLDSQAKLLTFLDTGTFTRVGGLDPIKPNTRILATTNRDLEEEVKCGKFRADLFYRLNVHRIEVPPLRDRPEDLPKIIEKVLPAICSRLGSNKVAKLSKTQIRALARYDWPGNVRELIAALERGLLSSFGRKFVLEDALPQLFAKQDSGKKERYSGHGGEGDWVLPVRFPKGESKSDLLGDAERQLVEEALRRSGGNVSHAARLLGSKRGRVRKAIERHGIIGPNEPTMA